MCQNEGRVSREYNKINFRRNILSFSYRVAKDAVRVLILLSAGLRH